MGTISEAIIKRANWFYDENDCCEQDEPLSTTENENLLDCTLREWLNQEQIVLLANEAEKAGLRTPEMFGRVLAEWLDSRTIGPPSSLRINMA